MISLSLSLSFFLSFSLFLRLPPSLPFDFCVSKDACVSSSSIQWALNCPNSKHHVCGASSMCAVTGLPLHRVARVCPTTVSLPLLHHGASHWTKPDDENTEKPPQTCSLIHIHAHQLCSDYAKILSHRSHQSAPAESPALLPKLQRCLAARG